MVRAGAKTSAGSHRPAVHAPAEATRAPAPARRPRGPVVAPVRSSVAVPAAGRLLRLQRTAAAFATAAERRP
jgi:hypothetical protein